MTRFGMFGIACGAALVASTTAFALPKAAEIYPKMGLGYNIGNTMEAPNGPTTWNNPFPTEELIDSVKAAGFTTVRIPTAWYSHSNAAAIDSNKTKPVPNGDEYAISPGWMDSVKMVVDWCIKKDLYVILNIHYDWGWLEQHIGTSVDEKVNTRQENFWKQIAEKFKEYDEHLLFASANEPGMNQPGANNGDTFKGDDSYTKTLKVYHETMIKAVRNSGGNNATRTVIVQGMNTDENLTHTQLKENMPQDPAGNGYMMGEFHFYPYQFSLMEEDASWGKCFYYWGDENLSTTDTQHNATKGAYASPEYLDSVFAMLHQDFDMPMIVGEFGAIKRLNLTGDNLKLHLKSRAAFYGKVAEASKKNGFVPVVWDTGFEGDKNMTIIRRQEGNKGILDYESLNAMRKAYGLDTLAGNSIDSLVKESVSTEDRALHVSFKTVQSDTAEAGRIRINTTDDWSKYVAVSFDMRVTGESAGPCLDTSRDGCNDYGWAYVAVFNMSGGWDWKQVSIGDVNKLGTLKNYKIEFGDGEEQLSFKNAAKMDAFGIVLQGTQFTGDMYLDNILLWKADGTADTLQSFNKTKPDIDGIAKGELIKANSTGDMPTAIQPTRAIAASKMLVNVQPGMVSASFTAATAAPAKAVLMNTMGQVIAQQNFTANKGMNRVELSSDYRGPAMLMVRQGSQKFIQKVILK